MERGQGLRPCQSSPVPPRRNPWPRPTLVGGMTAEPWAGRHSEFVSGWGCTNGRGREGEWRSPRGLLRIDAARIRALGGGRAGFPLASHRRGSGSPPSRQDSISLTWGLTDCADSITRRTCTRCRRRRCRRCHHLPSARIAASLRVRSRTTPICLFGRDEVLDDRYLSPPREPVGSWPSSGLWVPGSRLSSEPGSWRPPRRGEVAGSRSTALLDAGAGIRVGRWKSRT